MNNPFEIIDSRLSNIESLLLSIKHGTKDQVKSKFDEWLSLDELCNYLPEKPAKQTVYTWVSNKTIPFHKKGKNLYFLIEDIDAWLRSGRKKTVSEIEADTVNSISVKKKRG